MRQPKFPGMDPWLEHPAIWPDVHNRLIAAIADALVPLVDPRYYVGVESRRTTVRNLSMRQPKFPGMDPWLEHPAIWPDVHNSLITAVRDALVPLVDPRYYVGVESRMTALTLGEAAPRSYRPDVAITPGEPGGALPFGQPGALEAGGDVAVIEEVDALDVLLPVEEEVEETYLEVREVGTHRLVTALEVLSPSNKTPGKGRNTYLEKRAEVLDSRTNLIEIDLLRAGEAMPLGQPVRARDYRILIARGAPGPGRCC